MINTSNIFFIIHVIVYNISMNNNAFKDLLSLKEASNIWNVEESVLRRHILNGKFIIDIDAKKFGKQWIITRQAMERLYGIIDNSNSTNVQYSDSKKRDIYYLLSDCIITYSNKYKLDTIETSKLFKKYNLFKYIYDCYDYLHLSNTNNIVKDLVSRIRRDIKYEG